MRSIKKIAGVLFAVVIALGLIVLGNTLRLPTAPVAGAPRKAPPANLDAAVNRLAEAIRIPTMGVADGGSENNFAAFRQLLAARYPLTHAALKREVIGGGSLLFTWQGSDPLLRPILLTAHQDVAPVDPATEASWTHPPFSGAIADGFVWGRGAFDDKDMLMAILEATERLLAEGSKPKRTVLLAFGHDEELHGVHGAKAVADVLVERKVRAEYSLDEGGGILIDAIPMIGIPFAQIGVAEKGHMSVLLTASAKGGHSSMPPLETAVGKIGRAVARLEANQMPASLAGPGGDGLRALAPAMPFGMRAVTANDWLFGPFLLGKLSASPGTNANIRTTTAPTVIQGGIKENAMPEKATAIVNFRLVPGDTLAQVKTHIEKTIADPDVTIADYHGVGPNGSGVEASPVADKDGIGFKLIADAIRSIAPEAIVTPGLFIGGTDSKHYSRVSAAAYRFHPMRMTLEDIGGMHGINERIRIVDYGDMISFYLALVRTSAM